jgi:hypothetical protein
MDIILKIIADHWMAGVSAFLMVSWLVGLALSDGAPPKKMA